MAFLIQSGLHVSLDNITWYKLTDHNRDAISISPELIEQQARMANGKMRKYVIGQKNTISTSWKYVPSATNLVVDGQLQSADINFAAAWLESFYKANAGIPIYLKIISSEYQSEPATGSVPNVGDEPGTTISNFKTAAELTFNSGSSGLTGSTYTTSDETTAVADQKGSTLRKNATGFKVYNVYMTDFSKTIINRTKNSDYVYMSIEFTEI
jgi:hypothetical protein